jgi:Flp pilus assembly protein TadD
MIQDEIATAVTTALSVTLNAGEFNRPGMTRNVSAYDAFMQANKLFVDASDGRGNINATIDAMEQVVRIDPDYALAWFELARAYGYALTFLPPNQTAGLAGRREAALGRASTLAPDMPNLLQAQANTLISENRLAEAEVLYQQIIQDSDGADAIALSGYSTLLWRVGRVQDALVYIQQARRLDPLFSGTAFLLNTLLLQNGRIDEALEEIERGMSLEGYEVILSGNRFVAALLRQDRNAALQALQKMPNPDAPNSGAIDLRLANLWLEQGEAAALTALQTLVENPNISRIRMLVMAEWAAALGDPQLALDLYARHGRFEPYWLDYFSEARKLPDFKQIVTDIGLVDYWRATGNWGAYCRPLPGNDDFECF